MTTMSRDEQPPFQRGDTFYNGGVKESIFSDPLNYLGKEYVFEVNAQDSQTAYPTNQDSSGRLVRVRVVMNKSGVNLKPARIARYKALDPFETQVDGYTASVNDRPAGIIDEFLPPAGVPDGDLFYLVVEGPSLATQLSASSSVLVIGDRLVPGTGTSATNDDAGRVAKQDLSGATTALGNNIQNVVGLASVANNSVEDAKFAVVVRPVR
jgi:hypothetical protein